MRYYNAQHSSHKSTPVDLGGLYRFVLALVGEASSGKGTPGATTLLPNARLEKLSGQTGAASSEIARARNAAIERGERLQQLDLQTQEMADQAKGFGRSAAILAAKYEKKDKRWGLPF
ncbi:uncharacterized protein DC041_0006109 [Schistosoma bovis]|uniref:V-SNARE coiled-coil homology domain-containing protein n=1 Tax=Schistosoma bovis TaxID=6184 RepID=A0A430QSR7_SCHBO|nr:uncharacterized protein DC041_0006109 [Schistosoma bovis]